MTRYKGVDVSEHNGSILDKVIKDYDFVIIRTGWGSKNRKKQEDKEVYNNVKRCVKANKPFGFYHYSYATTVEEAKAEADFCVSIVDKVSNQGHRPLYPIVFDIEDKKQQALTVNQCTELCISFCEEVEKAGYYASIYSNYSFFRKNLDLEKLKKYDKWVADWTTRSNNEILKHLNFGIRQATVNRELNLDIDYAYKDYPKIINSLYHKDDESIKVGDKVKVIKPIIYGTNKKFKQYYENYEVMQIGKTDKNRIVIGRSGVITSAIDRKYLEVIK